MAARVFPHIMPVRRDAARGVRLLLVSTAALLPAPLAAASFGPPMLDITAQCSANSRRNVTAMSECIVAESEARAEILQKWHKIPDASAERCIKLGRKGQKYPYMKIAECLAAPVPAAPAAGTPAQTKPVQAKPVQAKPAPAAGRR